jgi:H+-transporting ATPase
LTDLSVGLTAHEARRRLDTGGQNAVVDVAQHPLRRAANKLWAPIPWMLEAAILLQLGLGDYVEAAVVLLLLLFNAALGFFQEGRAQATLDALKSRLALIASVRRDGQWTTVPASELVPGDIVKLSLGAVVAADVRLIEGSILIDQSMLTGESLPIEAVSGTEAYAGALVRRGEAIAQVTANGPLAFDNAVSAESAKTKGITSPVAGRADIFVVPDLEAGNMLAKQLEYLAQAQMAGIVLGARVPIILTSRSDGTLARLGSCAIALLLARHKGAKP